KHGSFRVIALTTTQVCPLMAHCGHSIMSHLMSVSGVKRTWPIAMHMSAFDPKRTSGSQSASLKSLRKVVLTEGHMQRRQFITLLGGTVMVWPLTAHAQQGERVRRIGVLLPASADDARFQTFVGAFLQELQSLGWSIGRNVRIDTRWGTANAAAIHRYTAELVALTPDVILAHGSSTVGPLLQATRTVPIVFPVVQDPVGAGFVDSLARPGSNATGFLSFEYGMSGKWLELLKEIAPSVARAAILRDASQGSGTSQFAAIAAVAPSLRIEVTPVNMRDADEIERSLAAFARTPSGGLIVTATGAGYIHRDLIITLAARHKLPAVYYEH